ncbi:hypothetical protein PanWU01x14_035780 [Parasponia andersonii]|uniref:Uncharacterized protein n=1 Tax=Parasponia andersonii TaxID=3476 RepID=A0A2P5DTA3_PARAD|nr:hypothetical protein PanWU01x14_035780 [Parasponia andersonii]
MGCANGMGPPFLGFIIVISFGVFEFVESLGLMITEQGLTEGGLVQELGGYRASGSGYPVPNSHSQLLWFSSRKRHVVPPHQLHPETTVCTMHVICCNCYQYGMLIRSVSHSRLTVDNDM